MLYKVENNWQNMYSCSRSGLYYRNLINETEKKNQENLEETIQDI